MEQADLGQCSYDSTTLAEGVSCIISLISPESEQDIAMIAEFFSNGDNGPLRRMRLEYLGPPWVFLAAVILLGLVILGVIVVKTLVEFTGALSCFIC